MCEGGFKCTAGKQGVCPTSAKTVMSLTRGPVDPGRLTENSLPDINIRSTDLYNSGVINWIYLCKCQ